ncbi:hypothetical protein ABIE24_001557 [Mycetocola sp. 2940]
MTISNSGKPPGRSPVSMRHARGWIVATAAMVAFVYTSRTAIILYLVVAGSNVTVPEDTSLPWLVALLGLAVVVASRRVSGFVFKLGQNIAVKLHIAKR